MHAPVNWTEPIIEAAFEISGIVLSGTLGLEFKEGIELIEMDRGFKIPKGKRVRIFNGGKNELILIEILQPAYNSKRVKQFNSFN
jgi:mannose-6-phosphate isomerase-like protein (cupin superfamily)